MRHNGVCGTEIAYDTSGRTFPLSSLGVNLEKEENESNEDLKIHNNDVRDGNRRFGCFFRATKRGQKAAAKAVAAGH